MAEHVIYTRVPPHEAKAALALLPRILAGNEPDRHGIARGFRLRLAAAFLSKVKQAFLVKSAGGTDEAGISWPPLSAAYLAYGRRFGRGEQAALKKSAGLGAGNRYAPGGNKGLLTKAQLTRWKQVYGHTFRTLSASVPIGEAKRKAAAIAWARIKKEGARTKLDVFGSRRVEILRDTGILFNSLSPGTLSAGGADASYSAPPGQVVRMGANDLVVGTNVPYATYHHNAKNPRAHRPLWPEPDQVPQAWHEDFAETAARGLTQAITLLVKGRAA